MIVRHLVLFHTGTVIIPCLFVFLLYDSTNIMFYHEHRYYNKFLWTIWTLGSCSLQQDISWSSAWLLRFLKDTAPERSFFFKQFCICSLSSLISSTLSYASPCELTSNANALLSGRYTSPKSQLVITALLTSVEVVINVSWLMYEPPTVTHSFPTRESRMLICKGLDGYSYMVGLLYPFVLIGNIWTQSCWMHQT